jgi:transcriptional regulator GlxA family with amidase domain
MYEVTFMNFTQAMAGFLLVVLGTLWAQSGGTLAAPAAGSIKVAFVLGDSAEMIDFAGPWEVFHDVMLAPDGKPVRSRPEAGEEAKIRHPFQLYTVSATKSPVEVSGGMKIVPDYSFADAPPPNVIVIPAQRSSPEAIDWVRSAAPKTDVTMSVCTGAFLLARTGLLDNQRATTHHWYRSDFEKVFHKVMLESHARFVENARTSTAAGLTSGIDLALRVVERYFGRDVATATADYMEYGSSRWK